MLEAGLFVGKLARSTPGICRAKDGFESGDWGGSMNISSTVAGCVRAPPASLLWVGGMDHRGGGCT